MDFQISNLSKRLRCIANWKLQIANLKLNRGFTVIELIISMTVFAILFGVIIFDLNKAQTHASLDTTVETLVTDLSQQQIKAMVGDTEGRTIVDDYGIRFGITNYTLFNAIYYATGSANFSVTLPSSQQISTIFPNSQILFRKGTGEIVNYSATLSAITVQDVMGNQQKTLHLNKYGVITSVQ